MGIPPQRGLWPNAHRIGQIVRGQPVAQCRLIAVAGIHEHGPARERGLDLCAGQLPLGGKGDMGFATRSPP